MKSKIAPAFSRIVFLLVFAAGCATSAPTPTLAPILQPTDTQTASAPDTHTPTAIAE